MRARISRMDEWTDVEALRRAMEDDDGRRFPRSTREAFPDERGRWFEPPEHDRLLPLWAGLLAVALAIGAALLLFG